MKFVSTSLKTLAAAMLLISATSAFAANYKDNYKGEAPCPPPKVLMGGFYLGAQGGYDSYRVQTSFSNAFTGVGSSSNLNSTGWVGGLLAGYGMYFSDLYYLGGEVFGNYSNASQSSNYSQFGDFSVNYKVSVQGSYGISLLPGIKLNDATLAYIRLGYNWASLKYQANINIVGVGSVGGSTTNTSGGFNYGLGMETLLYQNWSARAEYSHTGYNSFHSVTPSDNQFMVAVLYHFA